MLKDSAVETFLVGSTGDQAIVIPMKISASFAEGNEVKSSGKIGAALCGEIPYVTATLSRLLPEMRGFLKKTCLHIEADFGDCVIEGTSSSQLVLALSLCTLLRKSLGYAVQEHYAATGSLDSLGFIGHVDDLFIKRAAASGTKFIEPKKFQHLFDALDATGCLVRR